MDSKVVESLIAARVRAERSPLAELTQRELEILREIAQGKSNQAIAEELVLTKRAVEKHINAIFLKLGLSARRGRQPPGEGRPDLPVAAHGRRPADERPYSLTRMRPSGGPPGEMNPRAVRACHAP